MSSKSSIKWNPSLVDQDEGPMMFVVITIMTTLIILSTSTRIVVKIVSRLPFQIEDGLILVALAMNITCNAVEYEAIRLGFGRHLQFLTRKQERPIRMWNQFGILFANLAIWSVKMSICFFILALIRDVHQRSRWIVYGLITMTCLAHGCQTIVWACQARPLEKLWHPEIPGRVAPKKLLVDSIIAFTAISSVTDLFYAISPIYFFGKLQMDFKRKVMLLGLTGSGLLVFTSSIVRVAFVNDFFNPDITWALRRVYVCTIIERNLAEFIADLPVTFPLLRNVFKMAQGALTHGSGRGTSTSGSYGHRTDTSANPGKPVKRGEFAAYGKHGQFTTIRDDSDDEIEMRSPTMRRQRPVKQRREISVQVNIDVESQERRDKGPVWSNGTLRPEI